ncbi:MAG: VOC family protein [Deltaproteobacteria bacterium]|nr:VOC family protein [Deltaproteobacteria bacterium]
MSPIVHLDLGTGDPVAAKKFYKAMFSWKFQSMKMPDGVYHGFTAEGGPGGGIGPKPPGDAGPTMWVPYVGVGSVKKAIAKAQKLGAQVLVPYQPIGDMGAIGIFADPTGATFGVWETNPKAAAARAAAESSKPAKKGAAKKPAKKAAAKKPAKKAK